MSTPLFQSYMIFPFFQAGDNGACPTVRFYPDFPHSGHFGHFFQSIEVELRPHLPDHSHVNIGHLCKVSKGSNSVADLPDDF